MELINKRYKVNGTDIIKVISKSKRRTGFYIVEFEDNGETTEVGPRNLMMRTVYRKPKEKKPLHTIESVQETIDKNGKNISVQGVFKEDGYWKAALFCLECNHKWVTAIKNIRGCRKCAGTLRLTHEEFVERMKKERPDIEVVGKYVSMSTKIEVSSSECSHGTWKTNPMSLLYQKTGCPICNSSKGERRISEYLTTNNIEFTAERSPEWISKKRYDFIGKDFVIEFDGIQHFKPIDAWGGKDAYDRRVETDLYKTKTAIENGYRVIRISYSEIDSIEEILKRALSEDISVQLFGDEYKSLK